MRSWDLNSLEQWSFSSRPPLNATGGHFITDSCNRYLRFTTVWISAICTVTLSTPF